MQKNNPITVTLACLMLIGLAFSFATCQKAPDPVVTQPPSEYTKCRITGFVLNDIPNTEDSLNISVFNAQYTTLATTGELGGIGYGQLPRTFQLSTPDITDFTGYTTLRIHYVNPFVNGTDDLQLTMKYYRPAYTTATRTSTLPINSAGWKGALSLEWK